MDAWMNYQMWDQHWGWRNEPHNDDVKMILWTVFLVHCNFVKFILFAASCQRSVCNASILNGTSWCKSGWGCCPFKESDAGIPNLVLSPRASVQIDFCLWGSHFNFISFLTAPPSYLLRAFLIWSSSPLGKSWLMTICGLSVCSKLPWFTTPR